MIHAFASYIRASNCHTPCSTNDMDPPRTIYTQPLLLLARIELDFAGVINAGDFSVEFGVEWLVAIYAELLQCVVRHVRFHLIQLLLISINKFVGAFEFLAEQEYFRERLSLRLAGNCQRRQLRQ